LAQVRSHLAQVYTGSSCLEKLIDCSHLPEIMFKFLILALLVASVLVTEASAWKQCACEHNAHSTHLDCTKTSSCDCTGMVRYGHADTWSESKAVNGSIDCSNTIFNDPAEHQAKECECVKSCDATIPPANGVIGDCTDTLYSGLTCQPVCNPGHTLVGRSSCSDGTLTAATCRVTWQRCACEHDAHSTHADCNETNICLCTGLVRYGHADTWSESKEVDESIDAQIQFSTILFYTRQRNASVTPEPERLRPRLGNSVLANMIHFLLMQVAIQAASVSAKGRSVMDMQTPGPSPKKWMKALTAQMQFSTILIHTRQRNASVSHAGNSVLANMINILLIQVAIQAAHVSAQGRSVMDMQTPGPIPKLCKTALTAQIQFSTILFYTRQRNASVNKQPPPSIRRTRRAQLSLPMKLAQPHLGVSGARLATNGSVKTPCTTLKLILPIETSLQVFS